MKKEEYKTCEACKYYIAPERYQDMATCKKLAACDVGGFAEKCRYFKRPNKTK